MTPSIFIVMGVSGSGKSTVAAALAGRLDWELLEGDDLHSASSVDKMSHGIALTDEDRWPWLDSIAQWIDKQIADGEPGVITCSSLKKSYRDVLRRNEVQFVYLHGSREELEARLTSRLDHFMPAKLLESQLSALEPPTDDEHAMTVPIGPSATAIARQIAATVSSP